MHRHGEYKMPGGKLVVVDLELLAGRLERVVVSGDFFLDPDEALEAIDKALTGLPAATDTAALAQAVQAGLPEGTTMFGLSAEAIAVAVRRAVDGMPADDTPTT
ncbi:MAG: biotin--protein ligase [Burkholderiaceae bacterium]